MVILQSSNERSTSVSPRASISTKGSKPSRGIRSTTMLVPDVWEASETHMGMSRKHLYCFHSWQRTMNQLCGASIIWPLPLRGTSDVVGSALVFYCRTICHRISACLLAVDDSVPEIMSVACGLALIGPRSTHPNPCLWEFSPASGSDRAKESLPLKTMGDEKTFRNGGTSDPFPVDSSSGYFFVAPFFTPPFLPIKCARCSLSKRWGAMSGV